MNEKLTTPLQVIGRDPELTMKIVQMIGERQARRQRFNRRKNALSWIWKKPAVVLSCMMRWLQSWS